MLCVLSLYIGAIRSRIPLPTLLKIIIAFYFSYLFIGISKYLWQPEYKAFAVSIPKLLRAYLSSLIVILGTFYSSYQLIRDKGVGFLILIIFSVFFISASFIDLSPRIGLSSSFIIVTENERLGERSRGLFANPNEAGTFALYFVTIALVAFSYFKRYWVFFLAAVYFGIYLVFLSFSRASILVAFILILVFCVYQISRVRDFRIAYLGKTLIFSAVLLVGLIYSVSNFGETFESLSYSQRTRIVEAVQLLDGKVTRKTTSNREKLLRVTWEKIRRKPIFGYGIGTFHRLKDKIYGKQYGTHNTHLMIWGESGILPLLCFCFFVAMTIWAGLRHPINGIGFLFIGVSLVYFINVAGASHNALDERVSNVLIGIIGALDLFGKSVRSKLVRE